MAYFKLYYKARIMKNIWYWLKYRKGDQQNRTDIKQRAVKYCINLIFDKNQSSKILGKLNQYLAKISRITGNDFGRH